MKVIKQKRCLYLLFVLFVLFRSVLVVSAEPQDLYEVTFNGLNSLASVKVVNRDTGIEMEKKSDSVYQLPAGSYTYEIYLEDELYTNGGFQIVDAAQLIEIMLPDEEEKAPPDEEEPDIQPGDGSQDDDDGDLNADLENPGYTEGNGQISVQLPVDFNQDGDDLYAGGNGQGGNENGQGGNGNGGNGQGGSGNGNGGSNTGGNGTANGTGHGTAAADDGSNSQQNGQENQKNHSSDTQEKPKTEESKKQDGTAKEDRKTGEQDSNLHAMSQDGTKEQEKSTLKDQLQNKAGLSYTEVKISGEVPRAGSEGEQKSDDKVLVWVTALLTAGLLFGGMIQRGIRFRMSLQ